ncbi:MAG: hypothetical protein O7F08_13625 [Deltaproteobacteria bacterium]|nr:hypothetical protein [Deltaproteobacteria bacterium]
MFKRLVMFLLFVLVPLIGCQPKATPDATAGDATTTNAVDADAGAQDSTDAAASPTDAQAPDAEKKPKTNEGKKPDAPPGKPPEKAE